MTCKDCISYEVCENGQLFETPCVHYKNKADFAEVVRCKECKHFCYIENDRGKCLRHIVFMCSNDFCSYGENNNFKE